MSLISEQPFAYVVSSKFNAAFCSFCFAANAALERCSKCKFAHFCNRTCQKNAWPDHRSECNSLKKVFPRIPPDTARLMARIIFKLRERPDAGVSKALSDCSADSIVCRQFSDLMSHSGELRKDAFRAEHFATLCLVLQEYVGGESLPPGSDLLEIFGKVVVNSFNICTPDLLPVGVGLYLNLSALDHSCDPDACVVFDGQRAILNLIKPAAASLPFASLRVSYVELLATSAERKRQLSDQYYFSCDCAKCSADGRHQDELMQSWQCDDSCCDGPVVSRMNTSDVAGSEESVCQTCRKVSSRMEMAIFVMEQSKWRLARIDELTKSDREEDQLRKFEDCLDCAKQQASILHCLNVYRLRIWENLFDVCIALQKWPDAVKYGMETLYGYRSLYPCCHPSLGVQLMRLGKILVYLERLEEADVLLKQAETVLRRSHGTRHPLYSELLTLLESCKIGSLSSIPLQSLACEHS